MDCDFFYLKFFSFSLMYLSSSEEIERVIWKMMTKKMSVLEICSLSMDFLLP
jgi:hypothetical protein